VINYINIINSDSDNEFTEEKKQKEIVLNERRIYIPSSGHPWKRNKSGVWSYY